MKLITRTLAPLALTVLVAGGSVWAAPKTKPTQTAKTKAKPTQTAKTKAPAPKAVDKNATAARDNAAMLAAHQLLKNSAAAYQKLENYRSDVMWDNGSPLKPSGSIAWQRPDKLMAEVKMGPTTYRNFLSDGNFIEQVSDADGTRYTKEEVDTEDSEVHPLSDAMGSFGPVSLSLGEFLSNADPLAPYRGDPENPDKNKIKALSARAANAADAQGLDVPAVDLQVVTAMVDVDTGNATLPLTLTYTLDKKDKLLRRFNISYAMNTRQISQTETYTKVKANSALDAATLQFVPAATAELVDDLNPTYDKRLRTGAEPIALNATDLQGQPISFEQYKGKVVLVDFWATWCPPCRDEMPNVIATYNKYHDQGFEIIGVSLDKSKDALEQYTAVNKMPWPQVFDGKFWDSEVPRQFGVQSIPFTMIIGRDGKIAALNRRGKKLDKAVAKALAAPA